MIYPENFEIRTGFDRIRSLLSDRCLKSYGLIKGLIHDQSASGKTVYIEPAEIVEMNNEIVELEYEERRITTGIAMTRHPG